MMMRCLLCVSMLSLSAAFVSSTRSFIHHEVRLSSDVSKTEVVIEQNPSKFSAAAMAAMSSCLSFPLSAMAEVTDAGGDYEYGAVDAPISIAWVVGILVVSSSLLPLLLKPGEEALEQMRDQEAEKGIRFGRGDALGGKKKK